MTLTALSLMTSGGSCAISSNPPVLAPQLPPLDPRDEAPCYDPGVTGTYGQALTENRVALAHCRRTQQNVVRAYNDARQKLGPQ